MSYLKRVEKQRERDRMTEERRKTDSVDASAVGAVFDAFGGYKAVIDGTPDSCPALEVKPAPAERARCGRGLAWRCGMPRGHLAGCIRREQVTRKMFDAELVAMADRKAMEESVKAIEAARNADCEASLTPPIGSEGK